MARLEHVSVEGFKRVEHVAFDPGMVNVVTGRNNSGKTSLLEAVDLACDPTGVERFGGSHASLIRESRDTARVALTTADDERRVAFSVPDESEAEEILWEEFRRRLSEVVDGTRNQLDITADTRTTVESVISAAIDEIDVLRHVLSVSIDDETYPYIWYSERLSDVLLETGLELHAQLADEATPDDERRPPFGRGPVFSENRDGPLVGEVPPPFVGASILDVSELDDVAPEIDEEEHAVRRDDLGDFLSDRGILENLKSLGFDYLVFAENGHKRSVPFEFMGAGLQSLTRVLWELFADGLPEVVLLEEPDAHMHPGYVRELVYFLIELAREDQIQLFVTTHNNDFLNDLFTENLTEEERAFLEDEFRLVQMQDAGADVMDYAQAGETLKELKLDLRGL